MQPTMIINHRLTAKFRNASKAALRLPRTGDPDELLHEQAVPAAIVPHVRKDPQSGAHDDADDPPLRIDLAAEQSGGVLALRGHRNSVVQHRHGLRSPDRLEQRQN
jgi:hypothetical protein